MKKRSAAVFVLTVMLSFLFCLPVSAASDDPMDDLSIRFPSGYTQLTRNNLSRNFELVKKLGFTASSLKKYMQDENIYIIAAGEEVTGEFHIKCIESDFSSQIVSFTGLNSEALAKINQTLFDGNAEACTVGKSDTVYFRTKSKVQAAEFYTYQYVTVEKGRLYSFVYYGDSSNEIDEFMKNLKIKKNSSLNPSTFATVIVVAVVIIACIVVMGLIAVTVVSDMKKTPDEETEEAEYIRIKRRKM